MTNIKPIAVPPASVATNSSVKPTAVKIDAAKPATKKHAAKKVTARKVAARKPLSAAFAPVKAAKPVKKAQIVKAEKPKKPKLVRDSFTIPKLEYVVLEALKQRATTLTRSVKKSELLRAGIKALAALSDAGFLSALEKVPAIKTGRPASAK
jgi:hypothetical protein